VTKEGARGTILLVDDEPLIRRAVKSALDRDGHEIIEASRAAEARAALAREDGGLVDAILCDVMMPDESGLHFLAELQATRPQTPVVMTTASHDLEHVIAALRYRAYDYLLKPVPSDVLREVLAGAVLRGQTARELTARRMLDPDAASATGAVFAGPAMRAVLGVIEQVKDSSTPVMILGESGTGKEVVSRELHARGRRRAEPFVALNCAALPANLVEAELFGYEKGAFTGAVARKRGRFEEAGNGTIFLDEVGELELPIQAKLLRVLQEREVTRVGGDTVKVAARVVVATHRDLRAEVKAGRFREDLFYRLDVITLRLPPLRERPEEIASLCAHLCSRIARDEGIPEPTLTPEAVDALRAQPLRGNVRDLENILRRSALLSGKTTLGAADLQFAKHSEMPPPPTPETVESSRPSSPVSADPENVRPMKEYEREMMLRALAQSHGSVTDAARLLGIGRTTFYRRAKRFSIPL
jgi:DNA-binding NtrC family response regulator